MSGSKRSLPSWMGSSKDGEDDSSKKKHAGTSQKAQKGPDFSKLLDGVVFVLSGFVNPERSTLRSQALDMGAEYRADWTLDCTLLVCAFVNTPKFRQVQADNGTIISKDWIFESYKQKKLVDIEPFLMHAGKPWRKNKEPVETDQDEKETHKVHQKQVQQSRVKPSTSDATEAGNLESANKCFSPSKIKQWAVDDLAQTMSWLDSQEEKPEPSELKTIASEGVITCLQDTIESLEQGNDIKGVAEQWSFVPHVVNVLLKLDGGGKGAALPKEQLLQLAAKCKKIYQAEFVRVDIDAKNKDKHQNDSPVTEHRRKTKSDDDHYDSDETIEMTEEEIDFACRQLSGLSDDTH